MNKRAIGIEINGKAAIFVVLEIIDGTISQVLTKIHKLSLGDQTNSSEVRQFRDVVFSFFNEINADVIAIIKRADSGKFAAGQVTFKIEGVIQTYGNLDVQIVPLPTIKAHERKNACTVNPKYTYQQNSCLLAKYLLR